MNTSDSRLGWVVSFVTAGMFNQGQVFALVQICQSRCNFVGH